MKPPEFSIEEYVQEVLYGVTQGNRIYEGSLEVEEIEISNICFPARGQVGHCAEKLVGFALGRLAEDGTAKDTPAEQGAAPNR